MSEAESPQTPAGTVEEPAPVAVPRRRSAVVYAAGGAMALVVASVLGWLLYRDRDALASINLMHAWPRIVAGQALMVIGLLIVALVWASIMRALGSRLSALYHVHVYVTTLLSRYLPGTIWYVVGRSALYRAEGESARLVTVASAIELLLSTIAAALVAFALGLSLAAQTPVATLPVLAGTIVMGALVLHPRVLAWLALRLRLQEFPRVAFRSHLQWLLSNLAVWLIGGMIFWLIANEVGGVGTDSIPFLIFAWSLVGAISVFVFFLPSNFGLTEVGLSLLLSTLLPSSVAVVIAILTRILMLVFTAVGCGLIAGITTYRRRSLAPPATS